MSVIANPLGATGVAAEAAIARLCLEGLPALELFERAAAPLRRVVPYTAGCWKTVDPRTLLYTSFGSRTGRPGHSPPPAGGSSTTNFSNPITASTTSWPGAASR